MLLIPDQSCNSPMGVSGGEKTTDKKNRFGEMYDFVFSSLLKLSH